MFSLPSSTLRYLLASTAFLLFTEPATTANLIPSVQWSNLDLSHTVNYPSPSLAQSPSGDRQPELLLEAQGVLEPGDDQLEDASYRDVHRFTGKAGQQVTITVASPDFDTFLALIAPDGRGIEKNSDIDWSNTNSAIVAFTLPQSGTYQIVVNSYDPKGQGRYQLKVYDVSNGAIASLPKSQPETTALQGQQLMQLGVEQVATGQAEKGLDNLQQALKLFETEADLANQGLTLFGIGSAYDALGQYQSAIAAYEDALQIFRKIGDRQGERNTLDNLAETYIALGKYRQALPVFERALELAKQDSDRAVQADVLNNLGVNYDYLGKYQEAIKTYQQALAIHKARQDRSRQAKTLNNLGSIYRNLGQYQRALDYYKQSRQLRSERGDPAGESVILNNIGEIHLLIGQQQEKLGELAIAQQEYHQARSLYQEALKLAEIAGVRAGQVSVLNNLGMIHGHLQQYKQEQARYQQGLVIARELGSLGQVALLLNNLGSTAAIQGKHQEALDYYQQSLVKFRETGDLFNEVNTLNNMGLVYRDTNRPDKAIKSWEQSLEISLQMRGGLKRENRQKFLETIRATKIALADLLIKQNQPDLAYEWINRATTFNLANYSRLINVQVSDQEAQEALDLIQEKEQQIQLLRQQLKDEFKKNLAKRIRELEAELNQLREKTINEHPEVSELLESQAIDIDKFKQNIPEDTIIIQPVLLSGIRNVPDTVAIFILSKDQLKVIQKEIDSKQAFDQLVNQYRVQLENRQQRGRLKTSRKLYDLLIRPVEEEIKGLSPQHLAIIATGNLRYIPLETLNDNQTNQYLIQKYPVHYLTRLSSRTWELTQQKQILKIALLPIISIVILALVIGGLSFWISRKKVASLITGISILLIGGTVYLFINKNNYPTLALANPHPTNVPLLGTEAEAKSLKTIFFGSKAYFRENATLKEFQDSAFNFSFLHLGTHGCFQSGGCSKLDMEENTLLFANKETYHIRDAALLGLENTELITLSACQTAIVANDEDEVGVAALAYIFERAGAKSVIASLWNAEDNTSRDIMIQFYKNLKEGMNKSEALRQAKLSQIDRHPWFWSTFILIGDAN